MPPEHAVALTSCEATRRLPNSTLVTVGAELPLARVRAWPHGLASCQLPLDVVHVCWGFPGTRSFRLPVGWRDMEALAVGGLVGCRDNGPVCCGGMMGRRLACGAWSRACRPGRCPSSIGDWEFCGAGGKGKGRASVLCMHVYRVPLYNTAQQPQWLQSPAKRALRGGHLGSYAADGGNLGSRGRGPVALRCTQQPVTFSASEFSTRRLGLGVSGIAST